MKYAYTAIFTEKDGTVYARVPDLSKATPQQQIAHKKNDILSIIRADTTRYRAIAENKAIRKNVTLPAWLAEAAENANINFSQELQNALKQRLQITL